MRFHHVVSGIALSLLITALTFGSTLANAGGYDCTFGNFGRTLLSLPAGISYPWGQADIVIHPSGDYAGKISIASMTGNYPNQNFIVARLNADGSLDTSFGGDGFSDEIDFSSRDDHPMRAAALADGKVIVAGYSYTPDPSRLAMAKLNADGTLDTSFGTGGKVLLVVGSGASTWYDMVVDDSGNIYVAGGSSDSGEQKSTVLKFNSSGALQGTWKVNAVSGGSEEFWTIALQSDGKIVAGGNIYASSSRQNLVVRLNTDGTPDATFGSGGIKIWRAPGSDYDMVMAGLAIQSDGKIIAGGMSGVNSTNYDFAVSRLTAVGALDTLFSGDGMVSVNLNGINDSPRDLVLQNDGMIVIAGYTYLPGFISKYAAVRLTDSGALDGGFGTGGIQYVDFGGNSAAGYAVKQQADGKLLMAGPGAPSSGSTTLGVTRLHDVDFDMRYGASRITQNSEDIIPGASGNVLGLALCMEGTLSPLSLTGLNFNSASTTDPVDIASARVLYTGQEPAYDDTAPFFGSEVTGPGGSFSIAASEALSPNVTYYWLDYTVAGAAPLDGSHSVDAGIDSIVFSTGSAVPDNASPAGSRQIYWPLGGDNEYDWITNVDIAGIDNPSGQDPLGYGDYSALSTSVRQGATYPITVSGSFYSFEYLTVFVDWNGDGDVVDTHETSVLTTEAGEGLLSYSIPITVPMSATGGSHLLRVEMNYGAPSLGNGHVEYGEVEDYTLTVSAPNAVGLSSVTAHPAGGSMAVLLGGLGLSVVGLLAANGQRRRWSPEKHAVQSLS